MYICKKDDCFQNLISKLNLQLMSEPNQRFSQKERKIRTTLVKDPEVIPTLDKFYTSFNSKEIPASYQQKISLFLSAFGPIHLFEKNG
jgi:hypothetical protein